MSKFHGGGCAVVALAVLALTSVVSGQSDRVDASVKGSLLVYPNLELRWTSTGGLLQDTFITLLNDFPADVRVRVVYVNGDPPLAPDPPERAHPGWNNVYFDVPLTGDQPTYWSVLTGLPSTQGVSPFTALDPGFPPGRPDPEATNGERMLRGMAYAWAIDELDRQIRWNHLSGTLTGVHYGDSAAWEGRPFAYQATSLNPHGAPIGTPGLLRLDGDDYVQSFDQILLDFQAVGSDAFSRFPQSVVSDTFLALLPVGADFRQATAGPITTAARFDVWNENETKFSGTNRCITCWDRISIAHYGPPLPPFLVEVLQTEHGYAASTAWPAASATSTSTLPTASRSLRRRAIRSIRATS